jgi:hypothetical protein
MESAWISVRKQIQILSMSVILICWTCSQTRVSTILRLNSRVVEEAIDMWMTELEPIRGVKNLLPSMVTQMITEDHIAQSLKRGGNAMGLTPDDGPLLSKYSLPNLPTSLGSCFNAKTVSLISCSYFCSHSLE